MTRSELAGAGSVEPGDHPPRAFPDADWHDFRARCEAFAIPDPDAHRGVLEALYGHLLGVNAWLNLTRITAPRDYLQWHVLDSLVALGARPLDRLSEGAPCCDLGSGGGYPGLPLALWTPRVPWVLVDSRRRKVDFLAAASRIAAPARVSARQLRGREAARAAPDLARRCQLVVTRATGPTDKLLAECASLLAPHGHLLCYKGPGYRDDERRRAQEVAGTYGYRFVGERAVRLQEGDPERLLLCWQHG